MFRAVVLLGLVMALAAGCGGEGNVFDLAEGDCYNYDESEEVTDVDFVPCDEPHQREVYAALSFSESPGLPFPGSTRVMKVLDFVQLGGADPTSKSSRFSTPSTVPLSLTTYKR